MSNFDQEINKMQHLMEFGIKKSTPLNTNASLEHYIKAGNGKYYGVVKECKNLYIKVSEP